MTGLPIGFIEIGSICFIFAGIGWWKSGLSPFIWGMLACAHAEAARRLAIRSLIVAARHFWRRYGATVRLVREQFGEV